MGEASLGQRRIEIEVDRQGRCYEERGQPRGAHHQHSRGQGHHEEDQGNSARQEWLVRPMVMKERMDWSRVEVEEYVLARKDLTRSGGCSFCDVLISRHGPSQDR